MTQKHLKELAAAIANIARKSERLRAAAAVGEACSISNPKFKWSLWCDACNVDEADTRHLNSGTAGWVN